MAEAGDTQDGKQYLFDKPENVRTLLRWFFSACVLLVGIDVVDFVLRLLHVAQMRHVEVPAEALPGFYPLYGFIGSVFLVLSAKELRKLLMRDEDYYDR